MKRVFLLFIGILIICVSCQNELLDPNSEMLAAEKSAKYEKTKTYQIKGWVTVIPDWESPMFTCTPEDLGIEFCSRGWVAGHENILGTIVQEQSTYEKVSCEVTMTEDGPVVHNVVRSDILRTNGNRTVIICHMYINVATGDIWGQNELISGTGRFEGITGTTHILQAKMIPETGGITWKVAGFVNLVLK
ncbi:MAG: hypothetical protein R3182_03710 [Draconibacterium sp.]|nr:hypothetical protein [Draconibacterium sp.]